jgi:uncharacterized repeat protein (TIGR04076 family)
MEYDGHLDLGVDINAIQSYADYKRVWKRLAGVSATMIEKNEQCQHNIGDSFAYKNHYDKPAGICAALHHFLQLYVLRVSIGFPSWEDNPAVYRIHCPDKKGTVWELKRIETII